MEVGTEVWLRDQRGNNDWVAAILVSKTADSLTLRIEESGHEVTVAAPAEDAGDEMEAVKLRNQLSESEVDNLINLPYLHEPAILFCLECRYNAGDIYTYTGPILIAVNPFKRVPLYTPQILEMYYNHGLLKAQGVVDHMAALPPHVYAIADAAYRDMMGVILGGGGPKALGDQSILISGESGAGKTESTKIVLRYLTTVGSSSGSLETQTGSVMDKILQSNPILEAFGNARTLRNDNSSRFGKFIELNFNKRGHLIGGSIKTYLLEKVRLPYQQYGERNFHVFYQMAAGGSLEDTRGWGIDNIRDFKFVNQGDTFELRHVRDSDEFDEMRKALNTLNFDPEHQTSLFNIVASILHAGQIRFVPDKDGEGSEIAADAITTRSMRAAIDLLRISEADFVRAMTVRNIVTMNEKYEKKLTPDQALDARDALVKALYSRVFLWIVATINKSIEVDRKLVRSDIGVLDIFGFECFKRNSFEQLCINYTNETLQQQFNQFVFKLEQAEYQREKIEWSFIEFPDNQDCLDLIEHKVNGIIAMLDDECRLPKGSDEKFAGRLHKALAEHARFSASAAQKRNGEFCVKHYAGLVVYNTETFLDKNKDELPKEATALFQGSSDALINLVFASSAAPASAAAAAPGKASAARAPTVGSQFKEQLHSLMEKIYSTKPHYIRCLKPNDENVPDSFHRLRTTEQLRYGGVLEAVRVARSGFPVRLSHSDFYFRYRPLVNPFDDRISKLPRAIPEKATNAKEIVDLLLAVLWDNKFDKDEEESPTPSKKSRRNSKIDEIKAWRGKKDVPKESCQLGLTKVFIRKQAHDVLESWRSRRLVSAARKVQSTFRMCIYRSWFLQAVRAVRLLQRIVRGHFARKRVDSIRKNTAATLLQKAYRCHRGYVVYGRFKLSVLALQCYFRRRVASKTLFAMRRNAQAIRLQAILRGLNDRHRWLKYRRAVVALQCGLRCRVAKGILKAYRVEAKDVGRLQQSNEALKAEIEALRARAAEEAQRIQAEMMAKLEAAAKAAKEEDSKRTQDELEKTRKELDIERALRIDLESQLKTALEGKSAAESQLRVQASSPVGQADLEGALQKEAAMREALEDELERLRAELQTAQQQLSSASSQVNRRPDENPRRRGSKKGRLSSDEGHHHGPRTSENWIETWDDESEDSGSDVMGAASTVSESGSGGNYRPRASFSERVVPPAYTRPNQDSIVSVQQKVAQTKSAIDTFEKNLENFKGRLKEGVRVFVWDRTSARVEAMLKLVDEDILTFTPPVRRFSLFSAKIDIRPINVTDILECQAGADRERAQDLTDDSCVLTIICQSSVQSSVPPRVIVVLVDTREERNSLLTGLRTMVSDIQMHAATVEMLKTPPPKGKTTASTDASSSPPPNVGPKALSFKGPIKTPSKHSEVPAGGAEKSSNVVDTAVVDELKRSLMTESEKYERLMMQTLAMTNDLNEREDQIIALKKREAALEENLKIRERMYAQDAQVRLQLGKRLEQVLMDKEEIKDELDNLKAHLDIIRNGFQST